jgi:hypothetical protein
MALTRMLPTLTTSNAAFFTIFGIFIVAMLVLIFLTLRFVIRRDRAGRAAWLERQVERQIELPPQPQAGAPRAAPPDDRTS